MAGIKIETAAMDLVSENHEQSVRGYKVIKRYGGAATLVLLQVARKWDKDQQKKWLGIFAGGSPTDSLAYAIGDSEAVEALASAIDDPDPIFRRFAAFTLGRINDPRVPDLLSKAFYDDDAEVRRNAIYGFDQLDAQNAFELTMSAMNDPDDIVRRAAARILRWIGGPESVDVLIAALKDPSDRVVSAAASSLGYMGVEEAAEPLIAALSSEHKHLVSSAADALGKICDPRAADPLAGLLENPDYLIRSSATRALSKIDPSRVSECIIKPQNSPDTLAVEALESLKDDRGLQQLIDSRDKREHCDIIRALCDTKDARAVKPLIELFGRKTSSKYLRHAILDALGNICSPDAVSFIMSVLAEDGDDALEAAAALAKSGHDTGFDYLRSALKSDEELHRLMAMIKLRYIKDPRAVSLLIDALNDNSEHVRIRAIYALKITDDLHAAEHLKPLLNDKNRRVKVAAWIAINKIKINLT